MKQNNTLIGKNITLGKRVVLGHNVRIHSKVSIGDYSIIEDNVIIGHPSPAELTLFAKSLRAKKEVQMNDFVRMGTSIGKHCILRSGTVVYSGTRIGNGLDCGHNVLIREDCTIGKNVYILPNTQIHAHVRIGNNVRLYGFLSNRSIVEDDAAMLGVMAHKYYVKKGATEVSPIVKRGATVGMGAILVGNIVVGENAFVGANAVVTRNVEPDTLVYGVPARRQERHLKNVNRQ